MCRTLACAQIRLIPTLALAQPARDDILKLARIIRRAGLVGHFKMRLDDVMHIAEHRRRPLLAKSVAKPYREDREALEADYPSYDGAGQDAPSADAEARAARRVLRRVSRRSAAQFALAYISRHQAGV